MNQTLYPNIRGWCNGVYKYMSSYISIAVHTNSNHGV